MRIVELFRLVKSNLLRMKFRVVMTAAGVFIGITAVILLISMGAGLQRLVVDSFGNIGDLTELQVSAPGGSLFIGPGSTVTTEQTGDAVLNSAALEAFRELPGVVAVSPLLRLQANARLKLNRLTGFSNIQGIDTLELNKMDIAVESGAPTLAPWQALVGARVADNFFNEQTGQPATDIDLQGQTLQLALTKFSPEEGNIERTVRIRVVGVLAESGGQKDFSIYLPIRNVADLNAWANGRRQNYDRTGYDEALVKVESSEAATAVEQAITRQGFFVFSFQSILSGINTTFLVIQVVVGSIGGLALLVAAFGIANTMVMSIYERTREIGLMKAVGATNRDVMLIFLTEAGTIGLIGGIGGVLAGLGLGQIFGFVAREFLRAQVAQSGGSGAEMIGSPIYTPFWLPIFALAFAALVGVIAGIYPALRAIRLDPIAALRYE